jgi:hypothetical protein
MKTVIDLTTLKDYMSKNFALLLVTFILFACRTPAPDVTVTATAVVLPTATLPLPANTPEPVLSPTPTSLFEGLTSRLATPDPSPGCPDHYPWFFDNPASECAAVLTNTWAVMQPFEQGLMLWTQEGGHTFVLLDDGSPFKPFQEVFDRGQPYLPGPDPALAPPPGFHQPVLGFAKFWEGLVPGHEWVREQLGWATTQEMGYSALWQCNTAEGDAARCYISGPRDEIIVLARGSTPYWTYWQGPMR